MKLVGVAAVLLMLVAWSIVGTRLLLLARRTRGVPELTLGSGLFMMAVLGYPWSAVAQTGAFEPAVGFALFAWGTLFADLGAFLIFVFTWRVFRPGQSWATLLVLAALGLTQLHLLGTVDTHRLAFGSLPSARALQPWSFLILALVVVAFGWASCESLRYWAMLRKREKLGLAIPIVTNRFLLWGLMGSAITGLAVIDTLLIAALGDASHTPVAVVTSVVGVAASALLYLAFVPPAPYTRWIASRARP